MAQGDNLRDLIALARREMPEVPPEIWERFAVLASCHYGASRLYVPSQRKRLHLMAMTAQESQDAHRLAELLGLSVRHVRRLQRLR